MELLRITRQIHCKAVEERATLIHRQYNLDWGMSYSRPPMDPYLTSPCYKILAAPLVVGNAAQVVTRTLWSGGSHARPHRRCSWAELLDSHSQPVHRTVSIHSSVPCSSYRSKLSSRPDSHRSYLCTKTTTTCCGTDTERPHCCCHLPNNFALYPGTSAGFWLGGSMPPCRLKRRKFWKFDYEMVHSEEYLNKYVVSIAPFSTPACPDCSQNITLTQKHCMFSLFNFSSIFPGGGQLTLFTLCADAHAYAGYSLYLTPPCYKILAAPLDTCMGVRI